MQGIIKSLQVGLWFMFLTFPLMVIRVDTLNGTVDWRWQNMVMMGLGTFALSFLWRYMLARKEAGGRICPAGQRRRGRADGPRAQ